MVGRPDSGAKAESELDRTEDGSEGHAPSVRHMVSSRAGEASAEVTGDGERGPAPDTGPGPRGRDPWIGRSLAERYRIERLVGKGGMGRVYRATQIPLNRPVAVKILSAEFLRKDPQFVRRFYLEAASAARLTHPHTITVFDYGETPDGQLFIVMEHLQGRSLSKALAQDGPFSALRTLHVAMQICRALREAHGKGIIHRDLKPGNIMLSSEGDDADFVKVLDFGLVKLFTPPGGRRSPSIPRDLADADDEADPTDTGVFLGSPKYMSPEQIQGHPLDPRTDVYSLGVLLFQMLTGRPPFTGASSVEVIYRHVNDPVPSASDFGPEVPPGLMELVQRCLAKAPDDRIPSMAELLVRLKDLRRLLTGASADGGSYDSMLTSHGGTRASGPSAGSAPDGPLPASVRPLRPAPALGWMLGLGGVVLVAGVVTALWGPGLPFESDAAAPGPTPAKTEPETQTEPTAAPVRVRVQARSTPSGAEVFVDGEHRGTTPCSVQLSPSAALRRFVFRRSGYLEEVREVLVTEAGQKVEVLLRLEDGPAPNADGRRPEGPTPSDYKTNPY